MMIWLYPAALLGMTAIAGPIVVHLLRRQRAVRVAFPSVRFIQPSRAAAIRLRRPSDLLLLAARIGIVAIAAIAWARPLLVTPARVEAWNARVARAVVVDASDSMRVAQASGRTGLAEADAIAVREAPVAARIDDADVPRAIRQAVAALARQDPARRELVVISDFQAGALAVKDLRAVPASMGVRLIRVGEQPRERRFEAEPNTGVERTLRTEVTLAGATTTVTVTPGAGAVAGLRILGAGGAERSLLETVADAGTPAPSASQPLVIRFAVDDAIEAAASVSRTGAPAWMLETALRLRSDPDLTALAPSTDPTASLADEPPWLTLFRGRDGKPILRLAAGARELFIDAAVAPASLFAAAVVRGALLARSGPARYGDQEVDTIPAAELTRWSRPAPPVAADGWAEQAASRSGQAPTLRTDVSDARWWWGLLLLALAVETFAAGRRSDAAEEPRADAA